MFKKAKILDSDRITTSDFIDIVEHYYASGAGLKLKEKLSQDAYAAYLEANPLAI